MVGRHEIFCEKSKSSLNNLDFNKEKQRNIPVSVEWRLKSLAATMNDQSRNGFKAGLTLTRHVCQGTTQSRASYSAAVRNQTELITIQLFLYIYDSLLR